MQAALSHYRVLEQIGTGGMGVVYRAHDERLDRDIALKVLPPGTVVDPAARKRFRKEALMLSRLNHPNIATVHDFDSQDGTDFLVEELIEGLSLDVMLASGPLSELEIVNLGLQLCEGLAAAHDHGVIHRDLKPANLRITPEARLKILDFGLAEILREVTPDADTQSESGTRGIAGTLPYMAPEQLMPSRSKGHIDTRVDIWAAGCVLFEMATGRRPFLGSGVALSDAILHHSTPSARKLNPPISAALDAVIQKCLEKDAYRRYSSAREIAIDLRLTSTSAPPKVRRWFKSWIAALIISATIVLGLGASPRLRPKFDRIVAALTHWNPDGEVPKPAPHEPYLKGLELLERWDRSENLDAAVKMFQQAIKADPNSALAFSGLAEVYWAKYRLDRNSGWVEQAEKNCRRAAELNRDVPAVYVTLARIHNGRGQYNLALEEVKKALELAPLDADAQLAEASIFASMGQRDHAEEIYKKAAELRPQNWSGFYELAGFYYRSGRKSEAVGAFERALKITPDNALVHATLGGVLQLVQKYAGAEQHLKQSIELQPSYAAYNNLGAFYLRQKRWADAAFATREALKINASDWNAWGNLGQACEWLNRQSDADDAYRNEQERLEQLLKVRGDDAEAQAELGMVYSRWRWRERSVPLIAAALARAPDDPDILATAAEARENLGDRGFALKLVKKALIHGETVEQLKDVPSLQKLVQDPRFREIAQPFAK